MSDRDKVLVCLACIAWMAAMAGEEFLLTIARERVGRFAAIAAVSVLPALCRSRPLRV